MGVLTWLKGHFVGFPIHPIGLALGLTYPISQIWFSVFIAWVCKVVILKYGGPWLYRHLRPFFLGIRKALGGNSDLITPQKIKIPKLSDLDLISFF